MMKKRRKKGRKWPGREAVHQEIKVTFGITMTGRRVKEEQQGTIRLPGRK